MTDLYEILGVPHDADHSAIRKAYRKRASENHPDNGGETEMMALVNVAYETLSDPQKRDRYDRTGAYGPDRSLTEEAENAICGAFDGCIEHCDDYTDGVKVIARAFAEKHRLIEKSLKKTTGRIQQLEKRRGRVRKKAGTGVDLYERVLQLKLMAEKQKHELDQHALQVVETARKILADYECRVEREPDDAQIARSLGRRMATSMDDAIVRAVFGKSD